MNSAFVSTFTPTFSPKSPPTSTFALSPGTHAPVAAPSRRSTPSANLIGKVVSTVVPVVVDKLPKTHICLPQDEAEKRAEELEKAKEAYKWSQEEGISNASMVEGLPLAELPSIAWILELLPVISSILDNKIMSGQVDLLEKAKLASVAVPALHDAAKYVNDHNVQILNIFVDLLNTVAESEDINNAEDLVMEAFKRLLIAMGHEDNISLVDLVKDSFRSSHSTQNWKNQFRALPPGDVSKNDQFEEDVIFGWYRIAGPNPMKIKTFDGDLDDVFSDFERQKFSDIKGFENDDIDSAIAENRLYWVEYSELNEAIAAPGKIEGVPKQNKLFAPVCLLAVPKGANDVDVNDEDFHEKYRAKLLPIAIRTYVNGDPEEYPLFTPFNCSKYEWKGVKMTVQIADAVVHELVYHLGRTHLLMEVFMCATHRNLSKHHPLHVLLSPHLTGTCFINTLAANTLISPGSTIDLITAPQIEASQVIAAQSVNHESFKFNEWMPREDFAKRGVDTETNGLALPYPFRDHALQLWDAIHEWASAFVSHYYKSDDDVLADTELREWAAEIVHNKKGNLHGFGNDGDGSITTVEYLIDCVTMIIYTASVQHAAVNYPQSTMMGFSPAMPLAAYADAPSAPHQSNFKSGFHEKDLLDMYPPTSGINQAYTQLQVAHTLGTMVHTNLGDYGVALMSTSSEVKEAHAALKRNLERIEKDIRRQNEVEYKANLPPYIYLRPSRIPNSINI